MDQNPHPSDSDTLSTTSVSQTNLIRIISSICQKYKFLQLFLVCWLKAQKYMLLTKTLSNSYHQANSGMWKCSFSRPPLSQQLSPPSPNTNSTHPLSSALHGLIHLVLITTSWQCVPQLSSFFQKRRWRRRKFKKYAQDYRANNWEAWDLKLKL